MEISRPLHRKAKILWQLENLQNYKDLYGKPLERDWRAKRLLIQILLISNAHKNPPLRWLVTVSSTFQDLEFDGPL